MGTKTHRAHHGRRRPTRHGFQARCVSRNARRGAALDRQTRFRWDCRRRALFHPRPQRRRHDPPDPRRALFRRARRAREALPNKERNPAGYKAFIQFSNSVSKASVTQDETASAQPRETRHGNSMVIDGFSDGIGAAAARQRHDHAFSNTAISAPDARPFISNHLMPSGSRRTSIRRTAPASVVVLELLANLGNRVGSPSTRVRQHPAQENRRK